MLGLAAKAFNSGARSLKGKALTIAKYGAGAAGGYIGMKAGGVLGDFAGQAHIAYEGDTEKSQATAASMGKMGRVGGALLGGGLGFGGARSAIGGAKKVSSAKVASGMPPTPMSRSFTGPIRPAPPRQPWKANYARQNKRITDNINKRSAARADKRSIFNKSIMGKANRLSPFKADLRFAGAGAGLGVIGGLASESLRPTRRVAPEGRITGIQSSPRGGISPELQVSTQGLTLGIHNRRKQRMM